MGCDCPEMVGKENKRALFLGEKIIRKETFGDDVTSMVHLQICVIKCSSC
jgi:hypothetical protein